MALTPGFAGERHISKMIYDLLGKVIELTCLGYCRKYLPILKNMPSKYIYEPWAAPKSVQKASKCIVGYNYPVPMINHSKANAINLERMKMLYRQLAQKTGKFNNNKLSLSDGV